ncbi:MAG: hypothetical protein ABI863_21510 [Ginsengibacter sp.]
MKTISNCTTIEVGIKICREEEGKEICFQQAQYEMVCGIVAIEKCVFNKIVKGKRCDYLFLFDKNKQHYKYLQNKFSPAYYVELKGIELVEACEQLLNSIEKTIGQIKDFEINALVVSSRRFVPKYDNNEAYRELKRIIRKNVQFEITPHTINL